MDERQDQVSDEIRKENTQAMEKLRELADDLEAVVEYEKRLTDD